VLEVLGWIANSGERANALGSAYLAAKNVPSITSSTGVVYAAVPTSTQVLNAFAKELTAIVGAALGNPEAKENVMRVLDEVVKAAEDKPVAVEDKPVAVEDKPVEEEKGLLDQEWERMKQAVDVSLLPITGGWSLLKGMFNQGQEDVSKDTSQGASQGGGGMVVYRHDLMDRGF
jgi:hypothetical protein